MGYFENEMMNENRGRRNRQNADCGCWNEQETSCEWNGECNSCARQTSCAVQADCGCGVQRETGCGCGVQHETACGETHIWFESCDGAKEITLSSECHNEDSVGRILDVNMTLCNVCPGRRAAVGMHLVELDEAGTEYQRGFRAITVPAHNGAQNRDVALPAVRFIIPEDVAVSNGCRRHFVVRTDNHYMDEPGCWRR